MFIPPRLTVQAYKIALTFMLLATLLFFSYIFFPWKLNSMFLLYCRPTCFCQQYKLLPWKQPYVLFIVVIKLKTFPNTSSTIVTAGNCTWRADGGRTDVRNLIGAFGYSCERAVALYASDDSPLTLGLRS